MTRYIDADAYERKLMSLPDANTCEDFCYNAVNLLDAMPTVDAVPVVHGYWEEFTMSEKTGYDPTLASYYDPPYGHACSVCGCDAFINDCGDEILTKYCPDCGAKMDGE